MNKYIRLLKLKLEGRTVLTTTFINTKPKFRTIQPDARLSYNEIMNNLNQRDDVKPNRSSEQLTLEISSPNYSC